MVVRVVIPARLTALFPSSARCWRNFTIYIHRLYTQDLEGGRPTDRTTTERPYWNPKTSGRQEVEQEAEEQQTNSWTEMKTNAIKTIRTKKNIWKIYRQKFYNHNGHIDHHWAIESPTWRTASRILIINNNSNSNENEPMYPELKVFMDQNRPDAISPPAMATNPRSTHSFQVTQYQKCPVAAARTG